MSNIVTPLQNTTKTAIEKNFQAFCIKGKKRLAALASLDDDWDKIKWRYKSSDTLYFSTTEDGTYGGRAKNHRVPLPKSLASFAKAMVVNHVHNNELANLSGHNNIQGLINVVGLFSQTLNLATVTEIEQNHYNEIINYLCNKYTAPQSPIARFNIIIRLLNKYRLTVSTIQIEKSSKFSNKDEFGNLNASHNKKMPGRDLVKGIIDLKHAIYNPDNRSSQTNFDKLCIATQAFQFGMGLRLSEVLRLSSNCVTYIDERPYIMVWTEKGQEPQARPIPKKWEPVILDTIETVMQLTVLPRKTAREIETTRNLSVIDERFQNEMNNIEEIYHLFRKRVEEFLSNETTRARSLWKLPKKLVDKEYIDSFEFESLEIPFRFSRKTIKSELERKNIPSRVMLKKIHDTDTQRKRLTVADTEDVQKWLNEVIRTRENYLTVSEFYTLFQRSNQSLSANNIISEHIEIFTASWFNPLNGKGTVKAIPLKVAFSTAKTIISGGYDAENWVPTRKFATLFPELMASWEDSKEVGSDYNLDTVQADIYAPHNGNNIRGFHYQTLKNRNLISKQSLLDSLVKKFEKFSESSFDEANEIQGITIESRSFIVQQKLSDFLFLHFDRESSSVLIGSGLIPKSLSYNSVQYNFCGGKGYGEKICPGLFERYGITTDGKQAIDRFQSHGGRHWQTTSLFRAGAPDFAVDLYMGRTPGQGRQYDHNTGTERAELVKELLASDTKRFVGPVADKVNEMRQKGLSDAAIKTHLNDLFDTTHWTPYGGCIRNLPLNPCQYNVICLKGKSGNGCKHLIVDKNDTQVIDRIIDLRDKNEGEVQRLLVMHEEGNIHAEKHIEHKMDIMRNCDGLLQQVNNDDGTGIVQPFPAGDTPEENPFLK